jgi:hypothetical protein
MLFRTSDCDQVNRIRSNPGGNSASNLAITIHQSNLTKSLKIS